MGQIVVDVGSFDLTSHNSNTAYSSVRYFDIPANAGITSCVATFATHVNTGNFQGKSFSLNGTQAHPNTPWPSSGISLNVALLKTGSNTFRGAVKSQADKSARWHIGTIYLTINYNDPSGDGGGGSYIGGVSVSKTNAEISGGDPITVTCPAQNGYWHYVTWNFGSLSGYWSHGWGAGGTMNLTPAANWAEQIPSATSGVLLIKVYVYNTPSPPHNLVSELTFNVTLSVPYWMAPSITSFDAARIVNNTPSSISDYVQNISGVSLAMSGVYGSYGSSIVSTVISGGGFWFPATSGSIGRLPNVGSVDFTAEVTDSRGRKAYKSLNINVLAYTPITVSGVTAFRSNVSKTPADEGLFATLKAAMVISSLSGQNTGTVNGRVYEKGAIPSAWTAMPNDTLVLFGGSLSIEKVYTAEIKVSDLISEQTYNIDIPTATVIMGITADGDGVSFGAYPEAGKLKSAWPIVAPGLAPNPNLFHNWDFRNPVNQRGGEWFAGANVYGLDRWMNPAWGGAYGWDSSGFAFNSGGLSQRIERRPGLEGKIVTLSWCVSGKIYSTTFTMPSVVDTMATISSVAMEDNITIIPAVSLKSSYIHVEFGVTAQSTGWQMVKLELGPVSTLHLDPPMDYGTEFVKCQRFFLWTGKSTLLSLGAHAVASTQAMAFLPTVTPMRSVPTIINADNPFVFAGTYYPATISIGGVDPNGIILLFNTTGITVNTVVSVRCGNLQLSSDL